MIRRLGALTATALASFLILVAASSGPASVRTTGENAADAGRDDLGALVDELIAHQLTEERIPGAIVTVVADGRVVLDEGYGLADVDRHRPVVAG